MSENEAVAPAQAVGASSAIDLVKLKELRASTLAKLQEAGVADAEKMVSGIDKKINRLERGGTTGYVAPVVAYQDEEVQDRLAEIQTANVELLSKGGTLLVKITGGDVRPMTLLPNQVRHFSGQGIRRITQASPKGANEAPRCLNVVDMPDGSFSITAGNELNFPQASQKPWE